MNKKITILYIIDTYLPRPDQAAVGGTEKQLSLLASSLNPDIFRPIVVQLSSHPSQKTTETSGNVKLFHLPTFVFFDLIFFSNSINGSLYSGRQARCLTYFHYIIIVHQFPQVCHPELGSGSPPDENSTWVLSERFRPLQKTGGQASRNDKPFFASSVAILER
jgi:hypothetical protein